MKMFDASAGTAATEKLPAQLRAWGAGACEIEQQLLLEFATLTVGSSAWPISIRSQFLFVCGVAHSLACECANAQAETGRPMTANPSATKMLRILRIFIGLQLYHTPRHGDPSQSAKPIP
ncbi:MAG TPA: hypothetical protein VGR55_13745 [Candidatus Acidoferrum sp.]|nr:hypothetical protein [Candidatus Acidoferrum sp.]